MLSIFLVNTVLMVTSSMLGLSLITDWAVLPAFRFTFSSWLEQIDEYFLVVKLASPLPVSKQGWSDSSLCLLLAVLRMILWWLLPLCVCCDLTRLTGFAVYSYVTSSRRVELYSVLVGNQCLLKGCLFLGLVINKEHWSPKKKLKVGKQAKDL